MISLFDILFQESISSDEKKKYPNLAKYIDSDFSSFPPKYLSWAVKQLSKNPDDFAAKEISSLVSAFHQFATQNRISNKDINTYKTTADLASVIQHGASKETHGDVKKARRQARSEMSNETKVVVNDEKYLITIPNSWEDSCMLGVQPKSKEVGEDGEGEYWCVSNPFSKSAWDTHRQKGGKFVFVKSKQRNENDRYHLVAIEKWPSGMIQYTDAKNNLIDESNLESIFGNDLEMINQIVGSI